MSDRRFGKLLFSPEWFSSPTAGTYKAGSRPFKSPQYPPSAGLVVYFLAPLFTFISTSFSTRPL
ncbi:hypothetical protein BDZ94DRAFT_1259181 [Collybia nuda]|uniref:Uncharacterized protein n=1 Tax=Collybia nuda TaxID=64659 RepID=A0A9P5Y4X9_9AGAR|nr:hypothetical protein BDZ94DRAFT_1259181 [Collybia nuda]